MKKTLFAMLALASLVRAMPPKAMEPKVLEAGQPVPNFRLTNQNGKQVQLSQFRGKAVLLTFLFTQCPYPDKCPTIASKLKSTNDVLDKVGLLNQVQVLSVTLDPDRDTPQMLKAYAQGYDKKRVNWDFLTGKAESIEAIAAPLGVVYYDQKGTIQHNMKTAVIDPSGKLVRVFSGTDWSTEEAARSLRATLK